MESVIGMPERVTGIGGMRSRRYIQIHLTPYDGVAMLTESTRERWDATIDRVLHDDLEFHDKTSSLILAALGSTETPVPLPFAQCLRKTYTGVMNEPTFEPLDQRGQGLLMARILLRCLHHPRVPRPGPVHGEQTNRAAGVIRAIRHNFPDHGPVFEHALVAEFIAAQAELRS